jgi:AraC-like DNA-binding protein
MIIEENTTFILFGIYVDNFDIVLWILVAKMRNNKQEYVEVKQFSELPGLTLMHATYITQCFSRHSHDGFALGVIEDGALQFSYRGEKLIASSGTINLVNPDEPHDGYAASENGWTYRMFYLDHELIQSAANEICGKSVQLPFFQKGIIDDYDLASEIHSFHLDLSTVKMDKLEMESRLLHMLVRFIGRHADRSYPLFRTGPKHPAVILAKMLMEDLYYENISLAELAALSGISPFHLIRVFNAEIGLTPHRYLSQVRVRRAEQLIREGNDLAETAYGVGLSDQSHLNRLFKGIIGVTPGAYRNFLQDVAG